MREEVDIGGNSLVIFSYQDTQRVGIYAFNYMKSEFKSGKKYR